MSSQANNQDKDLQFKRDMTRLQEIIVRTESIKLLYMIQQSGGQMSSFEHSKDVDLDQRIADEYTILLNAVLAFGGVEAVNLL